MWDTNDINIGCGKSRDQRAEFLKLKSIKFFKYFTVCKSISDSINFQFDQPLQNIARAIP